MSSDQITNRGETTVRSELDTFLQEIKQRSSTSASTRGRLILALDATYSRQPTWDTACTLQADMFRATATTGGLDMQLVYYRGIGECRASRWYSQPEQLAKTMSRISCHAGETQIEKILAHAQRETKLLRVSALVFVGDAFEEEADTVIPAAHELGRLGVRAFMFQEGQDRAVERVFREIASATKGAYSRFDQGSAHQLAELLKAVAVYVTGGITALAARQDAGAVKLLSQMR